MEVGGSYASLCLSLNTDCPPLKMGTLIPTSYERSEDEVT